MTNQQQIKSQGFTLVELSIVIIIIGFLIAGIAAGQSLIQQSKLNAVINEISQLNTATFEFKDRYGYLPGDFPNAFSYWGVACAANAADCNGDGNGIIEWANSCPHNELLNMFVHLQLAGLIQGQYSGLCNGIGFDSTSVYNSKLSTKATWFMGEAPGHMFFFNSPTYANKVANMLILTNGGGPVNAENWDPVITPQDTQSIDTKIDDGLPKTGLMIAGFGRGPNDSCLSTTDNTYNLTETTPNCIIGYFGGYNE